jgi:dephospho-CoA kinase
MRVIAFTGMPFSGKSEAVEMAKKLGIPVIRMGDLVWEEVKNRHLDLTSENVGKVAHVMRVENGMDIWAKRTIQHIFEMKKSSMIVVDGIRNPEEIMTFKQNFGSDFLLISIDASDEIRHQRGLSRHRIDDSMDKKEILQRDEREKNWGLQKVMANADKTFKNECSLSSFQQKIHQFLDSL